MRVVLVVIICTSFAGCTAARHHTAGGGARFAFQADGRAEIRPDAANTWKWPFADPSWAAREDSAVAEPAPNEPLVSIRCAVVSLGSLADPLGTLLSIDSPSPRVLSGERVEAVSSLVRAVPTTQWVDSPRIILNPDRPAWVSVQDDSQGFKLHVMATDVESKSARVRFAAQDVRRAANAQWTRNWEARGEVELDAGQATVQFVNDDMVNRRLMLIVRVEWIHPRTADDRSVRSASKDTPIARLMALAH